MADDKKSYVRSVQSGKERLQFVAAVAKTDVSFYILHQEVVETEKDGKKVTSMKTLPNGKGGSTKFPNLEEASKAVDKGVEAALKDGWSLPAKAGGNTGLQKKADSFSLSNLPKPGGTKPIKSKP